MSGTAARPMIDPFRERYENAKRVIEAQDRMEREGIKPLTKAERALMAELVCRFVAEEFTDTNRDEYCDVNIGLQEPGGGGRFVRIDEMTGEVIDDTPWRGQ